MSTPNESIEQLHTLAAAGNVEALVKLGDHYLNEDIPEEENEHIKDADANDNEGDSDNEGDNENEDDTENVVMDTQDDSDNTNQGNLADDSENVNMDTADDDAKSAKEKELAKYAKRDQGKIKAIPYYYRAALLEHEYAMKQWEQASQSQFMKKSFSDGLKIDPKILEAKENNPIIQELRAASEKGDRHAQYLLGMYLLEGPKTGDYFGRQETAYMLLRKSATAGYPYARLQLAFTHNIPVKIGFKRTYLDFTYLSSYLADNLYEHTRYTVWLHYFAAAGCTEAQYKLACMLWQSYMFNSIISDHTDHADYFFNSSSNRTQEYILNFINQNNIQSMQTHTQLKLHSQDRSSPPQTLTHIDWLKRGIANNHFESEMALGHCYIHGDGVIKNKTLGKSILVKKLMEKFEKEKQDKTYLLQCIRAFDLPELLPYFRERGFTFGSTFDDDNALYCALVTHKYYLARSLVEHEVPVNFSENSKLKSPLYILVELIKDYEMNDDASDDSAKIALKYFKCILGLIPLFAQKGSQMEISDSGTPLPVSIARNIDTSSYEFEQPQQAILARTIQKLYLVLHVVTPMFEPGVMQVIANEVDLKYIASKGNVLETHRLKDRNEIDRLLNEVLRACIEELFRHHEVRLDEAVLILNAANINQDRKAVEELMFSVLYHHLRFCYLHKRQEEVFWKPYVDYLLCQDNKIFAHLMPIHYIILDFLENDKATSKGFSDDIEVDIDSVFHPANIKRTKSNLQFQRLKCVYQHLKARLDADLMLELPALEKESPLESNKRKLNELSKSSEAKELSTAPTDHLMEVPIEILQALQAFEDLNEDVRMTTEEEETQQQEDHGNAQQEQTQQQEEGEEQQAESLEEPQAKRRKLS